MKQTHGLICEHQLNGVTRKMSLQRYVENEEAKYLIVVESNIDGKALEVPVWFSETGYEMFVEFMAKAPYDLDRFKIDDVPKA
jgi:hypothetical protein